MTVLFPIAELAMIATSFAAMGVLVAYASWALRHGHSREWWRSHDPVATRRRANKQ